MSKFPLSAPALSALSTYLPPDLTKDQSDEIVDAVRELAEIVWREAQASASVLRVIRNSAEASEWQAEQARCWDEGWHAHYLEGERYKTGERPFTKENPYAGTEPMGSDTEES